LLDLMPFKTPIHRIIMFYKNRSHASGIYYQLLLIGYFFLVS